MYKITHASQLVVRLADGAFIPRDPGNADFAAFLAWQAEGGEPEIEPAPPEPVPAIVSRFQARAALLAAGLLDDVDAIMADPATPALTRLAWAEAVEFRRASPTVSAMSEALGLTEAQVDDLFIAAAGIEV
jgi:hypothetical protein